MLNYTKTKKISFERLLCNLKMYKYREMTKLLKSTVSSLGWGINNEPKAKKAYVKFMEEHHKDCSVKTCGLVVDRDMLFIKVSSDGISTCSCPKESKLVEIECPTQ